MQTFLAMPSVDFTRGKLEMMMVSHYWQYIIWKDVKCWIQRFGSNTPSSLGSHFHPHNRMLNSKPNMTDETKKYAPSHPMSIIATNDLKDAPFL